VELGFQASRTRLQGASWLGHAIDLCSIDDFLYNIGSPESTSAMTVAYHVNTSRAREKAQEIWCNWEQGQCDELIAAHGILGHSNNVTMSLDDSNRCPPNALYFDISGDIDQLAGLAYSLLWVRLVNVPFLEHLSTSVPTTFEGSR